MEVIECAWLRLLLAQDMFEETPDKIPFVLSFSSWTERYKPSIPLSMGSIAIHNILPSELEDCQPSSSFNLPLDCEYLIGHSISFDHEAIGRPPVKLICTHAISQWLWPDTDGHSQAALIYRICGAVPETRAMLKGAHNALADVYLNFRILQHILQQKPEITTWSKLWEFSEECRIPRTCPHKKYEGVLLEDLDVGYIHWCLRQDFIDQYFRKGLERVIAKRYGVAEDPMFREVGE